VESAGLLAGGHPVPLVGVEVDAEVVAGHARMRLRQRYRSDETKPIEAVYTFPLPARAAIVGFSLEVAGRRLAGEVQDRDEAFRVYDDALTAGHGAALVEEERPNVFTTSVGNLLAGEETVVELDVVVPVTVDEGAVRFVLPTLVAPRYVPATAPPDARRLTPPMGDARYGLRLDLVFDLGEEVEVESPSHAVIASSSGGRTRVSFAQKDVALDRDVVVTAQPRKTGATVQALPLASVVAHRSPEAAAFALTIVPDLGTTEARPSRTDVVFVLDRSGSMGGSSMDEARTALRLCLRQLREGDQFAVIAFDDAIEEMSPRLVPFTKRTLDEADAWLSRIDARGGTEMLEPLLRAVALAPDGLVVLLTDGQVGNEDQILRGVLERRGKARVYSFGIGTNVSDALLASLAEKTGAAVEMIHPGERVDEKVIAQFARATAPRVTDVDVRFRGVDVGEIAPAEPAALVDGEPFTMFGTYEAAGRGVAEIRGIHQGEKLYLEVPFDLPEREERPTIVKLWARARIRDLEHADVSGRRAETMKQRIVELAKRHGVSSKYTSFVVVEKRAGERRTNEQPETRVVPVNPPAGWSMVRGRRPPLYASAMMPLMAPGGAVPSPSPMSSSIGSMSAGAPPPMAARARATGAPPRAMASFAPPLPPAPAAPARPSFAVGAQAAYPGRDSGSDGASDGNGDAVVAVLGKQSASGLWESDGGDAFAATAARLVELVRLGITTSHPVHGAQTKKAVDAVLAAVAQRSSPDDPVVELALAAAWLLASGRRTRALIRDEASRRAGLGALVALLGSDEDVRAHVARIAPAVC